MYNSNSLNQTGKRYTTDSRKCNEYAKGFRPQYHIEYEYNGRKFVRVIANSCFTTKIFSLSNRDIFQLSNGEYYENGDAVWVEVTPITWLVDKNEDIAVSEKIIIAGIQFNEKSNYEGYFSKTNMYKFMNNFLIKDIIPSKINKLNTIEDNNKQEIIETLKKVELLEKEISEIESKKEELISTKARLRELMGIVIDDNGDTKGNQKVKKHEIESSK